MDQRERLSKRDSGMHRVSLNRTDLETMLRFWCTVEGCRKSVQCHSHLPRRAVPGSVLSCPALRDCIQRQEHSSIQHCRLLILRL